MINLFKGVSTKAFVIVILVLAMGSFGLWKLYTNNLINQGRLESTNVTLEQNVEHTEKSAEISDSVVTEYATKAMQSQQETTNLRKETINEYVKKIAPVAPAKEAAEPSIPDNGNDRVGYLADRLHENYCRARPQDPRCSPITPVK